MVRDIDIDRAVRRTWGETGKTAFQVADNSAPGRVGLDCVLPTTKWEEDVACRRNTSLFGENDRPARWGDDLEGMEFDEPVSAKRAVEVCWERS